MIINCSDVKKESPKVEEEDKRDEFWDGDPMADFVKKDEVESKAEKKNEEKAAEAFQDHKDKAKRLSRQSSSSTNKKQTSRSNSKDSKSNNGKIIKAFFNVRVVDIYGVVILIKLCSDVGSGVIQRQTSFNTAKNFFQNNQDEEKKTKKEVVVRNDSKSDESKSSVIKDLSEDDKMALWMPKGMTTATATATKSSRSASITPAQNKG